MLAVIETHPIQYHAPVYRALQERYGVPVTAIYGSDFSIARYRDSEFAADLTWDVDLLGGYDHRFLSHAVEGDTPDVSHVSAAGIGAALRSVSPMATLIVGYSPAFHRSAWFAAWRLRRPILFRGEASDMTQSRSRLIAAGRNGALRVAYRSCDRLLYIGERARRHYRSLGVAADRLVSSPYCVDTSPFQEGEADRLVLREAGRAQFGLRPDDFAILFSGKLSERKGADLLVAAVRRLPADLRAKAVLVFLGDGALRARIQAQADQLPRVAVRMAGFQVQSQLSRFYHLADLLVLPSRHSETWGLVVNEALHHGLPCVVSDCVGCAPDLIDARTGLVCRADSCAALADAISRARPLCGQAESRRDCREKVAQYTVDRAAAGIAAAYHSVIRGKEAA